MCKRVDWSVLAGEHFGCPHVSCPGSAHISWSGSGIQLSRACLVCDWAELPGAGSAPMRSGLLPARSLSKQALKSAFGCLSLSPAMQK